MSVLSVKVKLLGYFAEELGSEDGDQDDKAPEITVVTPDDRGQGALQQDILLSGSFFQNGITVSDISFSHGGGGKMLGSLVLGSLLLGSAIRSIHISRSSFQQQGMTLTPLRSIRSLDMRTLRSILSLRFSSISPIPGR